MKFELGPASIGDILDRGLKVLHDRFPTVYAINLLLLLPWPLMQLVAAAIQPSSLSLENAQPGAMGPDATQHMAIVLVGFVLILGLLAGMFVLLPVADGATVYLAWQEYRDRRVGFGRALGSTFRRLFQLLLTALMFWLVIGVAFLGGGVLGLTPALLVGYAINPVAGVIVCLVPAGVAALAAFVWLAFVNEIVMVEGAWGPQAFSRSIELVRGGWWRLLGLALLIFLVPQILGIAFNIGAAYVPYYELVPSSSPLEYVQKITNFPLYALVVCTKHLLMTVFDSFGSVCFALAYFDLRVRKEGFDLEVAALQETAADVEPVLASDGHA